MDILVIAGTVVVALAGLILSAVFLRTIISTNSEPAKSRQPVSKDTTPESAVRSSLQAIPEVAALFFLHRPPEVARFLNNPLELTDESEKKEFEEDLAASRKRHYGS